MTILNLWGLSALTFMMLMYAFERRGRIYVALFGCGCFLASIYGFMAGTWPFGVIEAIWGAIALHRFFAAPAR